MKSRAGWFGVFLLMGGLAAGVARAGVDEDAEAVYQDILIQTEQAHNEGQPARSSSDAAMMAGVKCQEMGAHQQAIALFKLAISEDSTNAEAYRRYGDYLIQYRGIVAPALYYKARALVEKNPNEYSDETKKEINRSLQILYRDARYGVPLFESMAVSMFVQPYVEYKEEGADRMELVKQGVFYSEQLDAKIVEAQGGTDYFSGQLEEQQHGINYFKEQVLDNEQGIEYFQTKIVESQQGFSDWHRYITNYFMVNFGYIPSDDEILDFDSQGRPITIRSRRNQMQQDVADFEDRIETIYGDKAANEKMIDRIRLDKSETQDKVDNAESNVLYYSEKQVDLAKDLPRRPKTLEYGAIGTIVFPTTKLPDFNFSARNISVEDAQYIMDEFERPGIGESIWEIYRAETGKRYLLSPSWDTDPAAFVEKRRAVLLNQETDYTLNRESVYEYGFRNGLTLSAPHKTFKLNTEASWSDIETIPGNDRVTGDPIKIDDAGNAQLISLRSSFYPASDELRFGQNRSTHLEVGVRRYERVYRSIDVFRPGVDEEDIMPFIVLEPLGRFRGLVDCPVKYVFHQFKRHTQYSEDTYDVHEVGIVPTLVPVYRLYARDFVTGMEELRIKFPVEGSWGDGDFNYYSAGMTMETRLVYRNRFAVKPSLGFDYRIYPDLDDEDDWGVFARLAVSM